MSDSSNQASTSARHQAKSQLQMLLNLVQIQRQARHVPDREAMALSMVNELHKLIPYRQAVFWQRGVTGAVRIETVSSVAVVERNSPYLLWLKEAIGHWLARDDHRGMLAFSKEDLPSELSVDWSEWNMGEVLWCPMLPPDGEVDSGLLLLRDEAWKESEQTLLESAMDAYAHAWGALGRPQGAFWQRLRSRLARKGVQVGAALATLLFLAMPVHETALAPAEVAPSKPMVAAAPLDGVIKAVHVLPNQAVQQGDVLFSLDDTQLRSDRDVAQKALEVARADYLRASQKAFADSDSLAQVAVLRAQMEEKQAELRHARERLARSTIRAERSGIVVFNDANDWIGRPVAVGERVMLLADPSQVELLAFLPVADAIALGEGARVRFFLNTDPTSPLDASLTRAAFEAEVTPEQVLAFRVRARFNDLEKEGASPPRIGLKGTAKLYGEQVSMIYYLLRRPIATLRQWLGW